MRAILVLNNSLPQASILIIAFNNVHYYIYYQLFLYFSFPQTTTTHIESSPIQTSIVFCLSFSLPFHIMSTPPSSPRFVYDVFVVEFSNFLQSYAHFFFSLSFSPAQHHNLCQVYPENLFIPLPFLLFLPPSFSSQSHYLFLLSSSALTVVFMCLKCIVPCVYQDVKTKLE